MLRASAAVHGDCWICSDSSRPTRCRLTWPGDSEDRSRAVISVTQSPNLQTHWRHLGWISRHDLCRPHQPKRYKPRSVRNFRHRFAPVGRNAWVARTLQRTHGGIQIRFGQWEVGAPDYRDRKFGSACGNRQVRVGSDLRESLTRLAAAEPEYTTKGGHT